MVDIDNSNIRDFSSISTTNLIIFVAQNEWKLKEIWCLHPQSILKNLYEQLFCGCLWWCAAVCVCFILLGLCLNLSTSTDPAASQKSPVGSKYSVSEV